MSVATVFQKRFCRAHARYVRGIFGLLDSQGSCKAEILRLYICVCVCVCVYWEEAVQREWEWKLICMIGCIYMIGSGYIYKVS